MTHKRLKPTCIFYDDDEEDRGDEAYEVDDDGDADDAVEALAQDMDLADDQIPEVGHSMYFVWPEGALGRRRRVSAFQERQQGGSAAIKKKPLAKKKSAHSSFFVVGDAPAGGPEKTTAANDVLVTENGVSLKPGYGAFTNASRWGARTQSRTWCCARRSSATMPPATGRREEIPPVRQRTHATHPLQGKRVQPLRHPGPMPRAESALEVPGFGGHVYQVRKESSLKRVVPKSWFGQGRDRTLSCSLWSKPPKVNKHIARKLSGRSLHQAPPRPVKPDLR